MEFKQMNGLPTELQEQVQWLVDREAIRELVSAYTRCVDERDFAGWQDLFAEDGVFIAPKGRVPKKDMADAVADILKDYPLTCHMLGQHSIEIDGDVGKGRCYFAAFHGLDTGDLMRHADIGGWYLHTYKRTAGGWKFLKVGARIMWASGEKFLP
ncbi:nuclear transport factor 2 family protein [Ramlibacter henchirensis]|uniref:Nuclear transport factor 2 family protein n=1 Tax=Ramlibacter henchirensis TaxID=204072 RepID=A0A4Z0BVZ2_9BURK|nr:nuclear transport factor 2 family protein [Ramlibacter henchirensis]TFZ02882.1 nuclear transport factor 2 family protein [Ramlibacter henchirensis]